MRILAQLERNAVPLIGRRAELDELRRAFSGAQVMVGHCVDFGDAAPPYLPFAELFSRAAIERPELAANSALRTVLGRAAGQGTMSTLCAVLSVARVCRAAP